MNGLLASLFDLARADMLTFGMVFLRIGALMALIPGFGERMIAGRVRLGLALAFTAIVAPAVADRLPAAAPGLPGFLVLLCAETLNGLALGFMIRLWLMAIEMAGSLAAQSGSLSQMFGTGGEPMPAMSHLLTSAALALAMIGGLHVRLAAGLILSYDALPPGQFPAASLMRDWGLAGISAAFALAFRLAAPFVIAALIYNVALGAMNRAMPALMVSFVGAPALSAGALILLLLSAPLMLSLWSGGFQAFLDDPFRLPR